MQIGKRDDLLSYSFDVFIVVVIFTNLFVTLYSTFDSSVAYKGILDTIELITVLIFTVEYVLRIWTSDFCGNFKDFKRCTFSKHEKIAGL